MTRNQHKIRHGSSSTTIVVATIAAIAVLTLALMWMGGYFKDTSTEMHGDALVVYCAAGVKPPVEAIAREFEKEPFGVPIRLHYDSSGALETKIELHAKINDLQYFSRLDIHNGKESFYWSRENVGRIIRQIETIDLDDSPLLFVCPTEVTAGSWCAEKGVQVADPSFFETRLHFFVSHGNLDCGDDFVEYNGWLPGSWNRLN